jgi:hypothetical protein
MNTERAHNILRIVLKPVSRARDLLGNLLVHKEEVLPGEINLIRGLSGCNRGRERFRFEIKRNL